MTKNEQFVLIQFVAIGMTGVMFGIWQHNVYAGAFVGILLMVVVP